MATCHLLEGSNIHAALEAACEATVVCENLQCHSAHSDDHYYLFSKNYTLQGLSCLLMGQLTPAEEYLQLAARWADSPTDKLISLSNIGSLFCTLGNFLSPTYDSSSLSFPSKEEVSTANCTVALTSLLNYKCDQAEASRDLVRQTALIRDGLEYWQEAVTEATQGSKKLNAAVCRSCVI